MRVKFPSRLALITALILVILAAHFGATTPVNASPAQQTTWTTIFADEFNGAANTGIDTSKWQYDLGHGYPGGAGNWGTGEVQNYTNSTTNIRQNGAGQLVITAVGSGTNWTSARIETPALFSAPVGGVMRIEGRIQQPAPSGSAGMGYWPAFWTLGQDFRPSMTNWPGSGEIDILEDVNGRSSVFGTLHCGIINGGPCNEKSGRGSGERACTGCQSSMHVYAIEYDRGLEEIRWYLDTTNYFTLHRTDIDAATWDATLHKGYFILINLAMGGEFPAALGFVDFNGTASGGQLIVDYVHVMTKGGSGTSPTNPPPTNPPPTNPPSGNDGSPFGGTARAVPGTIQSEDYNTGGQGVAWNDTTAGNNWAVYRNDDVDIQPTTDTGGGYDVGLNAVGEWQKYTVNVTSSGTYTIDFRVSSTNSTGRFHLEVDGANVTGTLAVPNTGAWQTFANVTKTGVSLSAGLHVLKLVTEATSMNYNWIKFTSSGTVPTTAPTTPPSGSDYTQGVTSLNSTQAKIWFKPTTASTLVDVHYLINGANQQNFRMTNNAGTWEQTVSGLTTGTVIEYWFTYEKGGPLFDTPHFSYTHGGGTVPTNTPITNPTATKTNTPAPSGTWAPGVAYSVGAIVTYGGQTYKCITAHTSQVGWEPPNAPSLWQLQSGTVPTNTPGTNPTATRTNTPISPTQPPSGTNLALNKPAAASAMCASTEGPDKAVNGSVSGGNSDKWCDNSSTSKWLKVDLTATFTVSQFVIKHAGAGGESTTMNTSAFNIQTSTDNVNWTTVITVSTNTASITTHNITARSARYIRLNVTNGGSDGTARIYEFEVYGSSSGTTPVPPTSTPVGSSPTPAPTNCAKVGTFPLCFVNATGGAWTDSQIYITFLGQTTPGQWYYMHSDGSLAHINHLDASASNHLTKNGVNYANMSFTLAQNKNIPMPARVQGGRFYVSLGAPMYIPISPDDMGWGGPDLRNSADPNVDTYYDWYEATWAYDTTVVGQRIPYGGNTTQVDQFGFPMTAQLVQSASGFNKTEGITTSRAQVFSQYRSSVPAAFAALALVGDKRIVAPRSSQDFSPLPNTTGSQQNYLQPAIDAAWSAWASGFSLTRQGVTFSGSVSGSNLSFTRNPAGVDGPGPFLMPKPTSRDVFECSGALASGNTTVHELGAEVCAALNRGVGTNTANWWGSPTTYYVSGVYNSYAKFFHQVGLNGHNYAFAYDDVNNQSSVLILPDNGIAPDSLTITIRW